ncbi:MAG: ATP-dependent helicase C-terminal domain-containing protein, partial [Pseudomonadota bacterium]
VIAERRVMFGALALETRPWKDAPPEAMASALCTGLRDLGPDLFETVLPWPAAAHGLRARIGWLRAQGGTLAGELPDMTALGLLETLEDWLLPFLSGETRPEALAAQTLQTALETALGRALIAAVDRAAPAHYETPLGGRAAIDYSAETPRLTLRVQELFGETRHPVAGDPPVPLVLELTSPAGRPVQRTRDLPGFWRSSYADVAKEMRARYPKHPWPDDPAGAAPTRRTKRRG